MNIINKRITAKNVLVRVLITCVIVLILSVFSACAGNETTIENIGFETHGNPVGGVVDEAAGGSVNETVSGVGDEAVGGVIAEATGIAVGEAINGAVCEAELQKLIYVYVCGAVCNPGVVAIPEGSRAEFALELAGGFADGANTVYVNLAAVVADGQRLYFPYLDDEKNQELGSQAFGGYGSTTDNADASGTGSSQTEASFPVNINTADVTKLCTVPGIGETRANAIIEYRNSYGLFESVDDIKKVSGIGEATFAKLEAYICVE